MKAKSTPKLRKDADAALQDWGRRQKKQCESCGKPSTVLHHHFPKSRSSALRYNLTNLVFLCIGCHFAHHKGDIRIANTYRKGRPSGWEDSLVLKSHTLYKMKQQDYIDIINKYKT